jgi:hypothetical protein
VLIPLLVLLQAAPQAQPPDAPPRGRGDCSRGVDFHALVTPETVYVGQQATYQLGVFIDQDTRSRLRRNPEFLPPDSRSMLSYDLPERGGMVGGGRQPCEVHMFRRALFPLTPGRYPIPSARLTYALPQNPGFFSREENYSLRSEPVSLVAIDPPTAGRPADWAGAVGTWRTTARLDTARARAGDPLVLTLRVEGQGNVTLLPRPALAIAWASVVAADERVRVDSTPTALRGSKEFDWLVTPAAGGAQRVPPIRFTYFNPFSRHYEVAVTQPITVRVAAGDVVAPDSTIEPAAAATPLTLRADLGDESPRPLGDFLWVRLLLGLAPVPALVAWVARRPRRTARVPTPLDRLRAMRQDPVQNGATPASVRRALLDGLRTRTGLEAAPLAQPGAWTEALRLEGVGDEPACAVEALLDELDRSAFGGAQAAPGDLASRAADLLQRVQRQAREAVQPRQRPGMRPGTSVAVGLAAVIGAAAALGARDLAQAREPFAQGMAAYAGADYLRASRLFEDAAREAPRASAAWANAGTAAWAARDTAGAVVGWQRALRLDPTSPELRSRLAQVRAPQDVGPARVLALPARFPSGVAIFLWFGGWALIMRQCWRRHAALPLIAATVVIAGGLGAAAWVFESSLEGRGFAVVTDPAPLRALPALGAEGGAIPLVGEVAHVVLRQGVWTHIRLDGGRDGWIATERVAPLGRD